MSAFANEWLQRYRARDSVFGVLSEAQWRVLLDLRQRGEPQSTTNCCIASGAPPTTALRHLGELIDAGFLHRAPSPTDQRCTMLSLSGQAIEAFERIEGWA